MMVAATSVDTAPVRCGCGIRTGTELVHPFASAIDTDLPIPPEHTHLMLDSKASWVEPQVQGHDRCFAEYPDESLAQWHQRLKLDDGARPPQGEAD